MNEPISTSPPLQNTSTIARSVECSLFQTSLYRLLISYWKQDTTPSTMLAYWLSNGTQLRRCFDSEGLERLEQWVMSPPSKFESPPISKFLAN